MAEMKTYSSAVHEGLNPPLATSPPPNQRLQRTPAAPLNRNPFGAGLEGGEDAHSQ